MSWFTCVKIEDSSLALPLLPAALYLSSPDVGYTAGRLVWF